MPAETLALSIVIPVYREAGFLDPQLSAMVDELDRYGLTYEILIVEQFSDQPTIDHSLAEPWASLNGNTVSLEAETAVLVKSGLHYEALVSAVNHRFSVTSTAIGVK